MQGGTPSYLRSPFKIQPVLYQGQTAAAAGHAMHLVRAWCVGVACLHIYTLLVSQC